MVLTLSGTLEEVREAARRLFGQDAQVVVQVHAPTSKVEPDKKSKPAVAAKPDAAPPSAPQSAAPTVDDIKGLIPRIIAAAGRPALTTLFGKYGVTRGGELKVEQYPAFMQDGTNLIAPPTK